MIELKHYEHKTINKKMFNKWWCYCYLSFKDKNYDNTPILRHKSNNKWFGVIFEQNKTLYINLKAKPMDVSILKDQYPEIILPAWHMNKEHWYKVDVNAINNPLLGRLIKISFDLTK